MSVVKLYKLIYIELLQARKLTGMNTETVLNMLPGIKCLSVGLWTDFVSGVSSQNCGGGIKMRVKFENGCSAHAILQ